MSIKHSCQIANKGSKSPPSLQRRLWLSYVRAAIVPLLAVEIGFLGIYWISNSLSYRENISTVGSVSRGLLREVAHQQADALSQELAGYAGKADLFAAQVGRALDGGFQPSREERTRHRFDPDGSIYSTRDLGGAASFYSSRTRPGPADLEPMLRLSSLDPLMIDLKRTTPGVVSVYFNSARSYNRIYPYFDAGRRYPHDMDIPAYNFYYQADATHNEERKPVWTDAYIDPAGQGWMISCVAPVWKGGQLAGVVGLDIGLQSIIDRLKAMNLPWKGYAVLVDRSGRIIALPPEGETDFKLHELTTHSYPAKIEQDSFKPERFDLNRRPDSHGLAAAMRKADSGDAELVFDGLHYASFATVPGPGWRLVVIAPARTINAPIEDLRDRLRLVGFSMFGGLFLFYAGFFLFLYRHARRLGAELARPLAEISGLMRRIGEGSHRQAFTGAGIAELDDLGGSLVAMGHRLGDAHEQIVAQELILREANRRQQQSAAQNARLVQVMSHELRTPLSIIDSGAQIIERKADNLKPDDLRRRSDRMRGAVRRLAELIDKLVASLGSPEDGDAGSATLAPLALEVVVAAAVAGFDSSRIKQGRTDPAVVLADPGAVTGALQAALDNALRYSGPAGKATVTVLREADTATIIIEDDGPGLGEADLAQAGNLFYRGENAVGSSGAGVSLHLARRRLVETGARLELTSPKENGGGLCVRIVLPLAEDGH